MYFSLLWKCNNSIPSSFKNSFFIPSLEHLTALQLPNLCSGLVNVLVSYGCHNKISQAGWLSNWNSHSLGGWKSKIKVPAGLVSPEASQLSDRSVLTVSAQGLSLVHAPPWCFFVFLLLRPPILLDQSSTFMASFHLNYLLKGPISDYDHTEGQAFNM